jgi:hypothetical protein
MTENIFIFNEPAKWKERTRKIEGDEKEEERKIKVDLDKYLFDTLKGKERRTLMQEKIRKLTGASLVPKCPTSHLRGMMKKSLERYNKSVGHVPGSKLHGKDIILTSAMHPLQRLVQKEEREKLVNHVMGPKKRGWDERGLKAAGPGMKYKNGMIVVRNPELLTKNKKK